MPGVQSAGAVYLRPLALGPIGQEVRILLEGQTEADGDRKNPLLNYQAATPDYFRVLRIELKSGRLFTSADRSGSPSVAIVSERAARTLWPGEDPVGKHVRMPTFGPVLTATAWRTVVGVVGDVRYRGLDDVRLDIYDAALQSPMTASHVMVRATGDPIQLAAAIQAEARGMDPQAIVGGITTMDAIVSRATGPWRFSAWVSALFSTLALLVAVVGLFSVIGLDVLRRSREFAVRKAIGAESREILRRVVWRACSRGLIGVGMGILGALVCARMIRTLLFGVDPVDLVTYVAVIFCVMTVVALASYLPARRASRVDPMQVLRSE